MYKIKYIFLLFLFTNTSPLKSISQYFCTAANDRYFPHLVHLIGSIHATNFNELGQIAVFNLGMAPQQIEFLKKIQKIEVYEIEKTHPDLLKHFNIGGRAVPGWYAWKPVCIKQALDLFPYILWIDAGSTILKSLESLFKHIQQHGYFLSTIGERYPDGTIMHNVRWCTTQTIIKKFKLDDPENKWILDQEVTMGGIIGACRSSMFYDNFIMPIYEMTFDLKNFEDDGSASGGFGSGRHDQPIYSALSRLQGLNVFAQDATEQTPMMLEIDNQQVPFYITWDARHVCEKTCIFSSRRYILNFTQYIRYK